jgi:hypothetical protein
VRFTLIIIFLTSTYSLGAQTSPVLPSQGGILFPIVSSGISLNELSIEVFTDLARMQYILTTNNSGDYYFALECLPEVGQEPTYPAALDGVYLTCNVNPIPVTFSGSNTPDPKIIEQIKSKITGSALIVKIPLLAGVNHIDISYKLEPLRGDDAIDILYQTVSLRNAKYWGNAIPRIHVIYYPIYGLPFTVTKFGDTIKWATHTSSDFGISSDQSTIFLRNGYLELNAENVRLPDQLQFSFPSAYSIPALNRFYNTSDNPLILSYFTMRNSFIGQEWNQTLANVRQKLSILSKQELRFMRNFVYAFYGYKFSDPELLSTFSKYYWYVVDPLLRQGSIRMDETDRIMLELIIEREKKLGG